MKQYQKNKAIKFSLIIFLCTVFSVLLHQIQSDPLMNLSSKTQSIIVTSGIFPPIAFVCLAITFSIIGIIFIGIQKHLWGTKLQKGIFFGLSICGVWIIGMAEAHVLFSLSLFTEIYTGFADSCGILLMCLLLGKYFAEDSLIKKSKPTISYLAITIIAITYIIVRYLSYSIFNIESAYITNSFETFLWTATMGTWIGVMYTFLNINIYKEIPIKNAFLFGGFIFGLQWIIFNLFALLFIIVPVSDLLIRSCLDITAIILGVYFFKLLRNKK
jgi:hypothetical protein